MSAVSIVRDAAAGLQSHLRWLSSAATLIGRPDRTEALLDRHDKCTARLREVDQLYHKFTLNCEDVPPEAFPETRRAQVHADYGQILELADAVSQHAREILAARAGEVPRRASVKTPVGLLSKLPTLDLPRFDGRLDQWLGFVHLFDSLVDSREDLGPSQKLAYLLSVLGGEARGLIQHLPISDGSYSVARALLSKRYHNLRCLADVHIDQILGLPAVATIATLRTELLNPLLIATNALARLELPVDKWSYLLVHVVLKRLPLTLRARFEQKHGGHDAAPLPTFTELSEFLEDECRMGDMMVADTPVGPPAPRPSNQRRNARGGPEGKAPPRFAAAHTRPDCGFCKSSGHRATHCPDFAALHVASRRRIARARGWCFSCMGDHFQRDCPDPRPCATCGGQHLRLLCANAPGTGRERDHGGSPTGGYARRHRDESRCLESGAPSPRNADCAAAERRQSPAHSPTGGYVRGHRDESRVLESPPPLRERERTPTVVYHDYRNALPVRMPSPPLAERPRLDSRPPRVGRSRRYELPPMARPQARRAEEEFEHSPRFDLPARGYGDRAQPRRD